MKSGGGGRTMISKYDMPPAISSFDWLRHLTVGGGAIWILVDIASRVFRKVGKESVGLSWPIAYGTVTDVDVSKGIRRSCLTLQYSYPVPDEPYPTPAEFEIEVVSAEANRWAEALDGKTIPVRVNPENCWKSQLLLSDLEPIVQASTSSSISVATVED
ncbi:MAG: hypothetical protein ACLP3R_22060 [Candidatus Korobacteraceae bacterium]